MMSLLGAGGAFPFHLSENVLTQMVTDELRSVRGLLAMISGPAEPVGSEILRTKAAELAETISQLRTAASSSIPGRAKP